MKNTLVAYFSASGVTKTAAEILAKTAGAELYEIRPAIPYTEADLDWENENSRSSLEMRDKNFRPELADTNANIAAYDTVFLGFPIWWYTAPTIINSFLEAYDFSNKRIILFATSGGSGFGKTVKDLKGSISSSASIQEGRLLNGTISKAVLESWILDLED